MHLKDYYSILELEPSATLQEIKKAYRKLALQYHPDKNDNDPYSAARFTAIKEAYEVLTDPAKKEYYLQQRWYDQSMGKRKKETVITPVTVLKQSIELEKYVSSLDVFRMDKEGLCEYITGIITDETIEKLNLFNELSVNKEIINHLLRAAAVLPLSLAEQVCTRLKKINADTITAETIQVFLQQHKKTDRQEKNKIWIVLIIVILLILLIYFTGL